MKHRWKLSYLYLTIVVIMDMINDLDSRMFHRTAKIQVFHTCGKVPKWGISLEEYYALDYDLLEVRLRWKWPQRLRSSTFILVLKATAWAGLRHKA